MPSPDSAFVGTSGDTLPSADLDFSRKSESSPVDPAVAVDVREGDQWVRIPVTQVEEWINKDGPADMTRTAKVKFPYVWGDHSIIQYINGFASQNNASEQQSPYDVCRIFFYDDEIEEWQITHYGYVGGIGPAADDNGIGKMWVYDPADLMKGIQVSKSWGEPTLSNVIDFALRGTDEQGNDVGLEKRSIFEGPIGVSVLGKQEIPQQKQEDIRDRDTQNFAITGSLPLIGSFRIPVPGLIGDIFKWVGENIVDPLLGGQKRFQINRHNMVDYMEWITGLIDARWWFEPSPDGPVLVIDATAFKSGAGKDEYERRYFVEDRVAEEGYSPPNKPIYARVNTLNNSALADIKPFNTMYLYGESTTYRERSSAGGYESRETAQEDYREAASAGAYTEEYPYVEVQYLPLLERAGGYEYSAQPIESDEVYLSDAKNKALKEFRNHLAEETEGSMQLTGDPHIMPFDYIVTVPTCNDTYRNADAEPVTWEVNGVKHTIKGGGEYTTELGVSLTFDRSQLNVTAEYREA